MLCLVKLRFIYLSSFLKYQNHFTTKNPQQQFFVDYHNYTHTTYGISVITYTRDMTPILSIDIWETSFDISYTNKVSSLRYLKDYELFSFILRAISPFIY